MIEAPARICSDGSNVTRERGVQRSVLTGGVIPERSAEPSDGQDETRLDLPSKTRLDMPRRTAEPTREDIPRRAPVPSEDARYRAPEDVSYRAPEPPEDIPGPPAGADGGSDEPPAPRRRSRWRWVRRAIYLLLAIIIAVPAFATYRVWSVARQDNRRHSDAIIVLGAAQYNGRPSAVLEWRLTHALKLYKEGVAPHIVTVGGNQPGDNYTEGGTGKRWLNEHGVPLTALDSVPTGHDTLQSMIAVGKEFKQRDWKTAVIVTDPWHALRSETMARDNGIKAVTSPTRSGPTVGSRDTQFHYIVRETGGYLYYVFIGRYRGDS